MIPLLVFVLFFSACENKSVSASNNINVNDIDIIIIKTLPSPPKVKKIHKKDDIKKIILFINSISKEKTKEENIKGWQFLIETKGKREHSISFVGNKINIDNVWYKISADELESLREIYNHLNYKEETVK